MSPIHQITDAAQTTLFRLAADLERIDEALKVVVDSLDGATGPLPREMATGAEAVRQDLLTDAAQTLRVLAHSSDASAKARQHSVKNTAESLLACGL